MFKKIVLNFIVLYKKLHLFPSSPCRFTPSCSDYTFLAIEKYGTINGIVKGLKRIIRCQPFSGDGFDPLK